MAKYYFWLKLKEDFFTDKRIKKLRKIAGGDTFTIIYLKLLLLSLKTNGVIEFEGVEDNIHEELALTLDEDTENVRLLLAYLFKNDMVEIRENQDLFLTEIDNLVGKEGKSAVRVRKYRKNKDELTQKNNTQALQCNTQALQCNKNVTVEKEKEIELELELKLELEKREKEIEREKVVSTSDSNTRTHSLTRSLTIYDSIIDLYNSTCINLPKIKTISQKRQKLLDNLLKQFTLDDFKTVFENANNSEFLSGQTKDWQANFDWLINAQNFVNTLENQYKTFSKQAEKDYKAEDDFTEYF